MIQIRKFDEKIYDPELGDGISSTEYIFEHYYKSDRPEDYFISFTQIDKIGINPRSEYATPIGIYTYPVKEFFETYVAHSRGPIDKGLTDKIKKMKIGEFAPFAGNNPWVWVMEIDRSKGRVFDISEYSDRDLEDDKERLKDIVINDFNKDEIEKLFWYDESFDDVSIYTLDLDTKVLHQLFNTMEKGAKVRTPAGIMWNILRLVSLENPVRWNKLFRQLGYICAIDRRGEGIIHENEKVQALFFQRRYFNVVDKVENIPASQKGIIDVDELTERIEEFISGIVGRLKDPVVNKGKIESRIMELDLYFKYELTPKQLEVAEKVWNDIVPKYLNKLNDDQKERLDNIIVGLHDDKQLNKIAVLYDGRIVIT
ncbi:MAG: hypothetical protein ACOCV8_05655 [Spirochaetota bacterium]